MNPVSLCTILEFVAPAGSCVELEVEGTTRNCTSSSESYPDVVGPRRSQKVSGMNSCARRDERTHRLPLGDEAEGRRSIRGRGMKVRKRIAHRCESITRGLEGL